MQTPPPPPEPSKNQDAELARTAAVGCFAGMGVVGITILVVLGVLVALALVGVFLLYLTCAGH